MSVLDEYLLLKQQQQELQQQQQLLQNHLLSQVLTEQQSQQHLGKQSCGQPQALGLAVGSSPSDNLFQMGPQNQVSNIQVTMSTDVNNMSPIVSQGDSHVSESETSTNLPHRMMEGTDHQNGLDAMLLAQSDENGDRKSADDNCLQNQTYPIDFTTDENVTLSISDDASPVPADQFEDTSCMPSVGVTDNEVSRPDHFDNLKMSSVDAVEVSKVQIKAFNEPSAPKEAKAVEASEVKKSSEKKSMKQKSSKAQSSDLAKTASKTQQANIFEMDVKVDEVKFDMQSVQEKMPPVETNSVSSDVSQISEKQNEVGLSGSMAQVNVQTQTGQRSWKPAPGFKPKSLLEIQQEEKRRAQAQAQVEVSITDISTSLGSINTSTPWAVVVGNSDHKENKTERVSSEQRVAEGSQNQKNKKGQLHDHLAGESASADNAFHDSILPMAGIQSESIDDANFIEAKEIKKSRKKSAKANAAGAKVSVPVAAAAEIHVSSSPNEKGKTSRHALQEDLLPAVPSGPSFGDFVVWKGEPPASSPAPAWSTDSGKLATHTSLRDILKEQEKNVSSSQHQTLVPTPQKSVPVQSTRSNGPSWSSSMSSPGKAASPIQIISHGSSHSKNKVDDDLFWGPVDHPKQETKQSDFPQLSNHGNWAKKTPVKGISGGSMSREKSMGGRPSETSFFSSPASKGKKDELTKHSEAMDFRDWCESECARLIGTKDTSFLEFCLKQSRSEAEILLKENLGSYDPDHEFIDKFLNYKDFMPSDVFEIAFQSQNDYQKVSGDASCINDGARDPNLGSSNGGGKKKGKKGKKVSPAVLGFNVVSNRIMMGEIQTIDD